MGTFKKCPGCGKFIDSQLMVCPHCGYVFTKPLLPPPKKKEPIPSGSLPPPVAYEHPPVPHAMPISSVQSDDLALLNSVKEELSARQDETGEIYRNVKPLVRAQLTYHIAKIQKMGESMVIKQILTTNEQELFAKIKLPDESQLNSLENLNVELIDIATNNKLYYAEKCTVFVTDKRLVIINTKKYIEESIRVPEPTAKKQTQQVNQITTQPTKFNITVINRASADIQSISRKNITGYRMLARSENSMKFYLHRGEPAALGIGIVMEIIGFLLGLTLFKEEWVGGWYEYSMIPDYTPIVLESVLVGVSIATWAILLRKYATEGYNELVWDKTKLYIPIGILSVKILLNFLYIPIASAIGYTPDSYIRLIFAELMWAPGTVLILYHIYRLYVPSFRQLEPPFMEDYRVIEVGVEEPITGARSVLRIMVPSKTAPSKMFEFFEALASMVEKEK